MLTDEEIKTVIKFCQDALRVNVMSAGTVRSAMNVSIARWKVGELLRRHGVSYQKIASSMKMLSHSPILIGVEKLRSSNRLMREYLALEYLWRRHLKLNYSATLNQIHFFFDVHGRECEQGAVPLE